MSPKQVLTIGVDELKVFEISCAGCGSQITVPLPRKELPPIFDCPGCNKRLWQNYEANPDQTYVRLLGIIRSLSNWQELNSERVKASFSLTE